MASLAFPAEHERSPEPEGLSLRRSAPYVTAVYPMTCYTLDYMEG